MVKIVTAMLRGGVESKNINVIIIGEMIWVFFCLFVFLKLVFVVFSCMLYLENDNFESIYDLFDGFLSFFHVLSDCSAEFTSAQEQQFVCAHPWYCPFSQHQPEQVCFL